MGTIWEKIEKTGMPAVIRGGVHGETHRPFLMFDADKGMTTVDAFQYLTPVSTVSFKLYSVLCAIFADYMTREKQKERKPDVAGFPDSPLMWAYHINDKGIIVVIDTLKQIMELDEDFSTWANKYRVNIKNRIINTIHVLRWAHVMAYQCGKLADFGPLIDCELYYDADSIYMEDSNEGMGAHIVLRRMPILGEWYSDIVPMIEEMEGAEK